MRRRGRRRMAWPAVALLASAGAALATSPDVVNAREDLRAAHEALEHSRRGLSAEMTVRPRLDLLARDDPPRPRTGDLDLRLGASLAWAPLRSGILLDEARVVEAELRLLDARREAFVGGLRSRVARARTGAAVSAAEEARRAASHEVASARHAVEEGAGTPADAAADGEAGIDAAESSAATAEADEARRRLARADLDLREALLDLADARRDREGLGRPAEPEVGPERPDLRLPGIGDVRTLGAFRARELRLAAAIAREERRRLDAFMPDLSLEGGYAGADAAVSAGLALAGGRPRGRLQVAWTGTRQERAWARMSLTLRLGSDADAALTSPADLAVSARATLEELADELEAEARADLAEAASRRSHWRLAEEHLAIEREEGDSRRIARAEEVARREWLRFLRAAVAAADTLEVPLEVR